MDIFKAAERLMAMDDEAWARHANPWSAWTRFTVLPLFVLAVWSRVWLGWWALLPVALVLVWNWLNPRFFAPPRSTDNWASKAVMGERIFLNRAEVPVPAHHARAAMVLTALSLPGMALLIYGLVVLDPLATVSGALLGVLPKVWFCDRMVWLYQDMKDADPRYVAWRRH